MDNYFDPPKVRIKQIRAIKKAIDVAKDAAKTAEIYAKYANIFIKK